MPAMPTIANCTRLLPGETLMSWVGRIARDEVGLPPYDFLSFINLKYRDVHDGAPSAVDRLAALSGLPRSQIMRSACEKLGDRSYQHQGERFGADFVLREQVAFCPSCLLEDRSRGGPSRRRRVGRVIWMFKPVRTCPVHEISLKRRSVTAYGECNQDLHLVASDDAHLTLWAAMAKSRAVSPLQTYVERRFAGESGPAWLDGQPIDVACRTAELLGAVLIHGPDVDLTKLSVDAWDVAGSVGFGFTSLGVECVRVALGDILARFPASRGLGGQQAFGPLFRWLHFNKTEIPRGPIEDEMRVFILGAV